MSNPYASSGVDTEAGDKAVELMKAAVSATHNKNILGGVGGFAGMMDAKFLKDYDHPILATSTDGVGTKVAIAQAIDKHDTIGQDLVGMVVDDIVVVGARSLFMTDYIAVGKVHPERVAAIVTGIANGCVQAGCALVGGETAEHPGLLGPDDYDIAGAGTGAQSRLPPHQAKPAHRQSPVCPDQGRWLRRRLQPRHRLHPRLAGHRRQGPQGLCALGVRAR